MIKKSQIHHEIFKNRMRQNIQIIYQKLMFVKFQNWLANDLNDWMTKWKILLMKTNKYQEFLLNWLSNVLLMWQQIFNLTIYFQFIELKTIIFFFTLTWIWKFKIVEIAKTKNLHWNTLSFVFFTRYFLSHISNLKSWNLSKM